MWLTFAAAVSLRVVLSLASPWLDGLLASSGEHVQYTDADYHVFSDAALLVLEGKSPYDRYTFRYPPVLALVQLPNHVLKWPEFGKLFFSLVDASIAILIYRIAVKCRGSVGWERRARLAAWMWALNPFSTIICSRGSADAIPNALMLYTLLSILSNNDIASGVALGLAVHLRLYPVIYFPALLIHVFSRRSSSPLTNSASFTAAAILSAAVCTAASYAAFGQRYLDEAILYHAKRSDHRHNFSPYFYDIYLKRSSQLASSPASSSTEPAAIDIVALIPFVPQVVLLAFNKVCTAQYFTWSLCFVPVAALRVAGGVSSRLWVVVAQQCVVFFVAFLSLWLWSAHSLEMRGVNTFESVWRYSLLLHMAQCATAAAVVRVAFDATRYGSDSRHQKKS
jgi:GPI mannosyltransferase 1 subunit M